ncbi:MAG: phosphotransferase, partial [candidate division WOR-3 bacterium]
MNILFALAVGYQVYYANLHAHTSYSDGIGLPGQAYCYARDTARIDVLALTDHTHYLTPGTYRQEREIAESCTEPGRFVALAGQEFGSLAQFGHLSIYDAESLCPVSTSDLAGFYNWLGEVQEPAQFNHPSLEDFGDFRYYRAADRYVTTIEVVNGSGLYTPVNEDKYLAALRAGWHCAPVANQDNHRGAWGNAPGANGQIPLTGI